MCAERISGFIVSKKVLGRGSFGKVYLGCLESDKSFRVAVKTMKVPPNMSKEMKKLLLGEIKSWGRVTKCDNPHIVALYNCVPRKNKYYFFMELCEQGTLQDLMSGRKKMDAKDVARIARHISIGMFEIYRNRLIHRDLKPANILLHERKCKIADFGFCKVLDPFQSLTASFVGTPMYLAPEISLSAYTNSVDIWSLGAILYECAVGKCAFDTSNRIACQNSTRKPEDINYPPTLDRKLFDFLKRILVFDGSITPPWKNRITYPELYSHPFINLPNLAYRSRWEPINESSPVYKLTKIHLQRRTKIDEEDGTQEIVDPSNNNPGTTKTNLEIMFPNLCLLVSRVSVFEKMKKWRISDGSDSTNFEFLMLKRNERNQGGEFNYEKKFISALEMFLYIAEFGVYEEEVMKIYPENAMGMYVKSLQFIHPFYTNVKKRKKEPFSVVGKEEKKKMKKMTSIEEWMCCKYEEIYNRFEKLLKKKQKEQKEEEEGEQDEEEEEKKKKKIDLLEAQMMKHCARVVEENRILVENLESNKYGTYVRLKKVVKILEYLRKEYSEEEGELISTYIVLTNDILRMIEKEM